MCRQGCKSCHGWLGEGNYACYVEEGPGGPAARGWHSFGRVPDLVAAKNKVKFEKFLFVSLLTLLGFV